MVDRTKSLEQLENKFWGEPTYPSGLVVNCHKYRTIPLKHLTPEQLRLLIGQNIGLEYLIPIAFEVLEQGLFIAGDLYEGDLLWSVLNSEKKYWDDNKENKLRLMELLKTKNFLQELDKFYPDDTSKRKRTGINKRLFEVYEKFINLTS